MDFKEIKELFNIEEDLYSFSNTTLNTIYGNSQPEVIHANVHYTALNSLLLLEILKELKKLNVNLDKEDKEDKKEPVKTTKKEEKPKEDKPTK